MTDREITNFFTFTVFNVQSEYQRKFTKTSQTCLFENYDLFQLFNFMKFLNLNHPPFLAIEKQRLS